MRECTGPAVRQPGLSGPPGWREGLSMFADTLFTFIEGQTPRWALVPCWVRFDPCPQAPSCPVENGMQGIMGNVLDNTYSVLVS